MKTIHLALQELAREKTLNLVKTAVDARHLRQWVSEAWNQQLAEALNAQMAKERDEYLGRPSHARPSGGRHRNGYRAASVPGFLGRIALKRPVVREGGFAPKCLEALRQGSRALVGLLAGRFWLKGGGTRDVAAEINRAFGTRLSASRISELTDAFAPAIEAWEKRPIPKGIRYLYLDALYTTVRRQESGVKQALLVAVGVDEGLHRHFLGFLLGDRESRASWKALLEDLLGRGLARESLRLVVSDAHGGIRAAVEAELALPHQLCVVHKLQRARLRVAGPDKSEFVKDFKAVYWAESRERSLVALGALREKWSRKYPKAVQVTEEEFEAYARFFEEEPRYWLITRSSNLVERFIQELRRRLKPARMIQTELELSKLVWGVATSQQERWDRLKVHTSRKGVNSQAA